MNLAVAGEQTGCTYDGMLAEYQVIDEMSVVRIPDHLSFERAATLPCAAVLAWAALNTPDRPLAARGDSADSRDGRGRPIRHPGDGCAWCPRHRGHLRRAEGGPADVRRRWRVIDRQVTPEWDKAVRELTGGLGADHVVNSVGPATLERSVLAAGFNGQIALLGAFPAGGAELPLDLLNGRFVTIPKHAVGSRSSFESFSRTLEQHGTRPVIDRMFCFLVNRMSAAAGMHQHPGFPGGRISRDYRLAC